MFGRRSKDGRKSPGRFMSGINDEVHGAHIDGGDIVLSKALGGLSFPYEEMSGPMPETQPGSFRLVLQEMRVMAGGNVGEPLVTSVTVPRDIVADLMSHGELSGLLSAYTPLEEDAVRVVREATGDEPLYYGSSAGLCQRDFRNYRPKAPLSTGEGLPGPACMFGDEVPELKEGADSDDFLDFSLGYHMEGDSIVLSPDLGGTSFDRWEMADSADRFKGGMYYPAIVPEVLADVTEGTGLARPPEGIVSCVMAKPVPEDIARRICQNYFRVGGLCVYTPAKGDAERLVRSLHPDAKHREREVPESAGWLATGALGLRGKDSVIVMYGRRRH